MDYNSNKNECPPQDVASSSRPFKPVFSTNRPKVMKPKKTSKVKEKYSVPSFSTELMDSFKPVKSFEHLNLVPLKSEIFIENTPEEEPRMSGDEGTKVTYKQYQCSIAGPETI